MKTTALFFALTVLLSLGLAWRWGAEDSTPPGYALVPLEKGNVLFSPGPDDYDDNGTLMVWLSPEDGGKLRCQADVETVAFSGTSPYIDAVNRTIKARAGAHRCSGDDALSGFVPKVTFFDGAFASITVEVTSLERGASGGCHSHNEYMNYDLVEGRQYGLPDIMRSDAFSKIRQDILRHFQSEPDVDQQELKELVDRQFWALGFFVKDHKLFVDMNTYLKSCAAGPFFPVEINPAYLDSERLPASVGYALGEGR